jgi:hypothetical protein
VLLALATFLLVGVALGVWLTLSVRSVLAEASSEATKGQSDLSAAAQVLKGDAFGLSVAQADEAAADFRRAEQRFTRARTLLTQTRAIRLLRLVPVAGEQINAAADLTDMGIHVSRMGGLLVQVVEAPLADQPSGTNTGLDPGQRVLALLQALDPKLGQVESELQQVTADRQRIHPAGLLPELAQAVAAFDSKLNGRTIENSLASLRADEAGLRQLLGGSGPRTYLILDQDPAELRATGGFIGTIAFLSFDHGKMAPFDTQDIDRIDETPNGAFVLGGPGTPTHVEPPYPLEYTLRIPSWELRDANWSPDFPTASREAEFLLDREAAKKVDGVIAIDPYFIERLLAIIGPIKIPQTGDVLDQNNFYAVTLNRVELNLSQDRKNFVSSAAKEILTRVLELPPSKWYELLQAMQWGCDARSLQAYFHDGAAQDLSDRHHCSGEVQSPPGDALMIVESNVGGQKDDFWMKRRFTLNVTINPDASSRHTLRLHYDGLSDHGFLLTGRWGYTGWLRVYLPPSTSVVSVTGAQLSPTTDLGHLVLQGWFYVQFDHSTDVTIIYDENATVTSGSQHRFVLSWQKQAGRLADPISVDIKLPAGLKLQSATMGSRKMPDGPIASDLAVDREFVFEYGE